jgi:hypothetical protein
MHPNPTTDLLHFNFKNEIIPSEIAVFDIQGKRITSYRQFSSNSIQLSTKNYNKGLYLVRITNRNGNVIYKKLVTQ